MMTERYLQHFMLFFIENRNFRVMMIYWSKYELGIPPNISNDLCKNIKAFQVVWCQEFLLKIDNFLCFLHIHNTCNFNVFSYSI